MSFPGKITSVIEEFGLFSKGDTVCVAVSGGVDSVVLLYLLSELSKTFRLKIIVCHLNHNLRGVESRADYNFTKKLAKGMGFIFEGKVLPKGKLTKKTNESLQEMARKERLNFLECTRRKFSADCIVLGHNQDDRAETVLMRLLKGTSLRGLTSIAPKRGFFVRPLINTSRSEIEEFAKAREIKFRVDSSNKSRKYLRNKVRLDLLPALEQEYNPRIREALSRLASLVSIDDDFIEEATTRALSKKNNLLTKTAGGVLIDRLKFLKLHKAVQGRVLLKAINLIVKDRVKADVFVEDISNFNIYGSHLDAVQGVILSLRPNLSIDLPEGIYFIREYDKLRFTRDLPKEVVFNLPLKVGAVKKIKQLGLEVELRILKNKPKTVSQNPFVTHFDLDELEFFAPKTKKLTLRVRGVLPGDKLRPFGLDGHKKLKDIFIDEKTPKSHRRLIPILTAGSGSGNILWVVGIRRSDFAKVTSATKRVLKIQFRDLK